MVVNTNTHTIRHSVAVTLISAVKVAPLPGTNMNSNVSMAMTTFRGTRTFLRMLRVPCPRSVGGTSFAWVVVSKL